jgi:hypothetical protein
MIGTNKGSVLVSKEGSEGVFSTGSLFENCFFMKVSKDDQMILDGYSVFPDLITLKNSGVIPK